MLRSIYNHFILDADIFSARPTPIDFRPPLSTQT